MSHAAFHVTCSYMFIQIYGCTRNWKLKSKQFLWHEHFKQHIQLRLFHSVSRKWVNISDYTQKEKSFSYHACSHVNCPTYCLQRRRSQRHEVRETHTVSPLKTWLCKSQINAKTSARSGSGEEEISWHTDAGKSDLGCRSVSVIRRWTKEKGTERRTCALWER